MRRRRRRVAGKMRQHGQSRWATVEHRVVPHTRTVQRHRVQLATSAHRQRTSAKPPSAVRLRSPPPRTSLHPAISGRARPSTELTLRQNCRHSADETRRHALSRRHTGRMQLSAAAPAGLCGLPFAHSQARGSVLRRSRQLHLGSWADCRILVRHSTGGSLCPEGTYRPVSLGSGSASVSPSERGSALRPTTSPKALASDSCSEWQLESAWGSGSRSSMSPSLLVIDAPGRLRERVPNKRIKLACRGAGGLTTGRRARSLSAVRWANTGGRWS